MMMMRRTAASLLANIYCYGDLPIVLECCPKISLQRCSLFVVVALLRSDKSHGIHLSHRDITLFETDTSRYYFDKEKEIDIDTKMTMIEMR
jgi:hypothetical protein